MCSNVSRPTILLGLCSPSTSTIQNITHVHNYASTHLTLNHHFQAQYFEIAHFFKLNPLMIKSNGIFITMSKYNIPNHHKKHKANFFIQNPHIDLLHIYLVQHNRKKERCALFTSIERVRRLPESIPNMHTTYKSIFKHVA